jgi:epsilon-lactone hydrolase
MGRTFLARFAAGLVRLIFKSRLRSPASMEWNLRFERRWRWAAAPPRSLRRVADVTEVPHGDAAPCRLYRVEPKGATCTLLYLHGGCYTFPITPFHWDLIRELAAQAGARVFVALYPLAPESTVTRTLDAVAAVYARHVLPAAEADGHGVGLMGDSAGAGLSLALAQRLAAGAGVPGTPRQADSLLLLSPWLDASLTAHADAVAAVEPSDAMLRVPGLVHAAHLYAGSAALSTPVTRYHRTKAWLRDVGAANAAADAAPGAAPPAPVPLSDPRVSPLHGPVAGLPRAVTLLIGTRDIFLADCRAWRDRVAAEAAAAAAAAAAGTSATATTAAGAGGVPRLRYVEGADMIHVWPLLARLGVRESVQAVAQIAASVREDTITVAAEAAKAAPPPPAPPAGAPPATPSAATSAAATPV